MQKLLYSSLRKTASKLQTRYTTDEAERTVNSGNKKREKRETEKKKKKKKKKEEEGEKEKIKEAWMETGEGRSERKV